MIHEILPPEKCAECKGCCFFDKDDAWEAPAPLLPEKDGVMVCCHLTESGCERKNRKPLECALYPFRVMKMGEHTVIALCRYCKAVTDLPLTRVLAFVDEKAAELFELAENNPQTVKEYNREYVILKTL